MTVNEAVKLMPGVDKFKIAADGLAYDFDPHDPLHVAAFGGFDVDRLTPSVFGENTMEIELSRKFVKNGIAG